MPGPARRISVRPAMLLCLALAASFALACGSALGAGRQQQQAVGSQAGGAVAPVAPVAPATPATPAVPAAPSGPSTVTGSAPPVTTLPPAAGGTPASTAVSPLASQTGVPRSAGPGTATAAATTARPPASAGASKGGVSGGAILAAVLAALIALACLVWAVFRLGAFEPPWLLSWRHSLAEAGFRASATWAEFSDWLRLGH